MVDPRRNSYRPLRPVLELLQRPASRDKPCSAHHWNSTLVCRILRSAVPRRTRNDSVTCRNNLNYQWRSSDREFKMKLPARRTLIIGYLCAIGAAMGYGGSQVVAKQVITETEPLVGSAFTLLFGLIILGALTARDVKQQKPAPKIAYIRAILAGLASAGGVTFLYLALSHAPVVNIAPVTAINPLFSIALAQIFLRNIERLPPRILAGALLAIAGVIVISISTAA